MKIYLLLNSHYFCTTEQSKISKVSCYSSESSVINKDERMLWTVISSLCEVLLLLFSQDIFGLILLFHPFSIYVLSLTCLFRECLLISIAKFLSNWRTFLFEINSSGNSPATVCLCVCVRVWPVEVDFLLLSCDFHWSI